MEGNSIPIVRLRSDENFSRSSSQRITLTPYVVLADAAPCGGLTSPPARATTGLRLGRRRTLVLPLTRAESVLGVVLPRTGRATGLLERTMGARGATSAHALRDGSRARDVGL